MKFYSELTKQFYDDVKTAEKAEKDYQNKIAMEKIKKEKLANERAARAKEVEDAAKAVTEAQKTYREKLAAFTKDFGAFHMTYHVGDADPFSLFDLFF